MNDKERIDRGIEQAREGLDQAHHGIRLHQHLARVFLTSINDFKQAEYRLAKGEDPVIPSVAGTLTAPSLEKLSKGQRLLELVEGFRDAQDINCPETIYQTDRVIVNAYEFTIGPVTFPSRVEAARLLGISTAVLYKCLHPNATPQQKQSLLVRVMKFDMAQQKERQNER